MAWAKLWAIFPQISVCKNFGKKWLGRNFGRFFHRSVSIQTFGNILGDFFSPARPVALLQVDLIISRPRLAAIEKNEKKYN
jgi:hypothetical protein